MQPGERAAGKPCAGTNTPEAKDATCATLSTRTGSKEEAPNEKGKQRSHKRGDGWAATYSGPNKRVMGFGNAFRMREQMRLIFAIFTLLCARVVGSGAG